MLACALRSRSLDELSELNCVRLLMVTCAVLVASAGAAAADPIPGGAGDFTGAFGMGWESFDAPINPSTRDEAGNRVIINGRMEIEGALSGGLQDGFATGIGSAQAVGNQLNVITQGDYNTVIVDATQINNGDVVAEVDGDE
jgi:holdfast attachment protein HfaA